MTAIGTVQTHGAAAALKEQIDRALDVLSNRMIDRNNQRVGDTERVQGMIRLLGRAVAGWAEVPNDAFPSHGAGFGSTVEVEDLDWGERATYTLMSGPLLDIDAGDVSLASVIGQALIGASVGDVLSVQTPRSIRRLRVVSVRTLREKLRDDCALKLAA